MEHARKCIAPAVCLLLVLAGPLPAQEAADPADVLIHLDADGKLVNPLATMSPERLKRVRRVRFGPAGPSVLASIDRLDLTRVTLHWFDGRSGPEALPEFPAGTRYLEIWLWDYNDPRYIHTSVRDFSSLKKLTELRSLDAVAPESNFDLAWIVSNPHLKALKLRGMRILSPGLLSKFTKLERLDLSRAAIGDLSPIAELPAIREVDAGFSRVRVLPPAPMPSLRVLRLCGAELTDETVGKFRVANPECHVFHRWGTILQERLAGSDRVRVLRPVDPEDSENPEKPVVAEVSDVEKVRALIRGIEFHDDLCFDGLGRADEPGGPVLEFMLGNRLQGRIRISAAPRPEARFLVVVWPGVFPGPGTLTPKSAERMVAWLSAQGESGPERRLDRLRRERAPDVRRWQTYRRYVPEYTLRWLNTMITPVWIPDEFVHAFPDPVERARACLLLLGGNEGSWHRDVALDEHLVAMLAAVEGRIFLRAATSAVASAAGTNGLARWLFGERRLDTLDRRTRRKILADVARLSLASPRRINRQRTMDGLALIGTREAKSLLREVAAGKIKVRKLDDAERRELESPRPDRQSDFPPERDVTDAEYAREKLRGQ